MSKYIKKNENGFYVFDEMEFLKTLPTGLEYFAVDKETEQIYNLGFNYKEKMDKQISDLEAKLAECEEKKESYRLQNEQHHLQLLQFYSRLGVEAFGADIHEKALETLMIMKEQLAESEKQIKDAREAGNMAVDSWCKNRRKYEAQIAEMQNKSFILYSMLYETLEKQGCDNVASQIDQMTGWTYDKEADWLKGNRNYDQLKQQLAESEKKNFELVAKLNLKEHKPAFCILADRDCEALGQVEELQKQLHDLPKKIVGEITNELSNNTSLYFEMRESTSAHCPNKEYEWFNYVRFRNYINAILEKFGEKDE